MSNPKIAWLKDCTDLAKKLSNNLLVDEESTDLYKQLKEEKRRVTRLIYIKVDNMLNMLNHENEMFGGDGLSETDREKFRLDILKINLATFHYYLYRNEKLECSLNNFFRNVIPSIDRKLERNIADDYQFYVDARTLLLIQLLKKGDSLKTAVKKCFPDSPDKLFDTPHQLHFEYYYAVSEKRTIVTNSPVYNKKKTQRTDFFLKNYIHSFCLKVKRKLWLLDLASQTLE